MSVKVMGLVWDLDIPRDQKFVLLAYADHADHDGGNIFPSVETVAKKTGYSKRSLQRITRKLEKNGYLIAEGGQSGGLGITAHWSIPIKDDKIAPFQKGDKLSTKRVTKTTSKGDIAVSPDPSLTVINHPNIKEIRKNGGVVQYLMDIFDLPEIDSKTKKMIESQENYFGDETYCQIIYKAMSRIPTLKIGSLLMRIEEHGTTYLSG